MDGAAENQPLRYRVSSKCTKPRSLEEQISRLRDRLQGSLSGAVNIALLPRILRGEATNGRLLLQLSLLLEGIFANYWWVLV